MKNAFFEFCKKNKGLVTGVSIGALIGILILTINFWRTLFLAICIGLGALLGKNENLRKGIINFLDRILPFK